MAFLHCEAQTFIPSLCFLPVNLLLIYNMTYFSPTGSLISLRAHDADCPQIYHRVKEDDTYLLYKLPSHLQKRNAGY